MTIPLLALLVVAFVHWFADFVCQTDWQAKNKSSNNRALTAHVTTYTAMLIFFGLGWFSNPIIGLFWALGNGVVHWGVDWVTSRCSGFFYKKGDTHNFFVVVGLDQFIHLACLATSAAFLL